MNVTAIQEEKHKAKDGGDWKFTLQQSNILREHFASKRTYAFRILTFEVENIKSPMRVFVKTSNLYSIA